jgi:hypothetical protein
MAYVTSSDPIPKQQRPEADDHESTPIAFRRLARIRDEGTLSPNATVFVVDTGRGQRCSAPDMSGFDRGQLGFLVDSVEWMKRWPEDSPSLSAFISEWVRSCFRTFGMQVQLGS